MKFVLLRTEISKSFFMWKSIILTVILSNLNYCLSHNATIIMAYKEISSSELNIIGNTIQCNETRINIKICAGECFEKNEMKENCVGFSANENNCSLCRVLDRDEINKNLNTTVSENQVLYLLEVPKIDPNIYISMEDFNLSAGTIRGKGVSGESDLISAGDLIKGKVGQAIHFHDKGRIYARVDQPECFCSFYYCKGTMSVSFWARSTPRHQHQQVITPSSGLTVVFQAHSAHAICWFNAKGIRLTAFGVYPYII